MQLSASVGSSESLIEVSEWQRHFKCLLNFSPFLYLIRNNKNVVVAALLVERADSCIAQMHLNSNHMHFSCNIFVHNLVELSRVGQMGSVCRQVM